jgi:[CysO sulfur-carrier protein]-S-L-cysteine hydrolase
VFTITKRQYEIIMHQAQACWPQESGGFLGGREDVILGVLPTFNMHLYDRTNTFGIPADDFDRAYRFFEKYKLDFYGIYHSHPKGIPYPSRQDLANNQRYQFIVGLRDRYNPELYAYEIVNGEVVPVPVQIVDEALVEQMYLSPEKPKLNDAAKPDDLKELETMIDNIIQGRDNEYVKEPPKWDSSSFSTKA